MGSKEATYEVVIRASKKAHAHDFISALPKGYDTLVSERATSLSGGQRQRLSLARSLLKPYSVYIFDEVTNALDSSTEKLVQNTINELSKDCIVIQISHLKSSTKNADQVYEINSNGNASLKSTKN